MQCERCKEREATVHMTQVLGYEVNPVHICEACATESGLIINSAEKLSIHELALSLNGISSAVIPTHKEHAPRERAQACPSCQMRRADFLKIGQLGCADCYTTFTEEVSPMIQRLHRAEQHVGKVPAHATKRAQAVAESAVLRQALAQAVAGENFEEAALLRDCLASLSGNEPAQESRQRTTTAAGFERGKS